jgi:hypothetical protein
MGWTKQQSAYLLNLFREGKAPHEPDNGKSISAPVIKKVWESHALFQTNYSLKNFYPLYRRKAAEFLCDKNKNGARRRKFLEFVWMMNAVILLLSISISSIRSVLLIPFFPL